MKAKPQLFERTHTTPALRCIPLVLLAVASCAQACGQTLGEALNATNLEWSTSGDLPWFVQTNVTHDGVAAVQSGAVTNGQVSVLSTTVTGPGNLTFWWQLPDQGPVYVRLRVDGVEQARATGTGWAHRTNFVAEGTHLIEWVFTNASAFPSAYSVARLDQVEFTLGATTPLITAQPASLAQAPGLTVSFSVRATGTPPLHYQWRRDGIDLPGDSSTLTITNISSSDAGAYSALVSNDAGSLLSSNAQLSIVCVASWNGVNDTPPYLTNALALAVGSHGHSLALLPDGNVAAWGYNADGQASVPAGLTNAVSIAAGDFHSLALKPDSTLAAWGRNDYGQIAIPTELTNAVAIAAYGNRSMALTADGKVRMWGGPNYHGEMNVPPDLTDVVAISLGLGHSLVLRRDGTLRAWGDNFLGAATIPPAATNIVAIAAGFTDSVVLRADGAVLAWGENYSGEANVPANLTNVAAVAAGVFSSFALLKDGSVVAWGGVWATVPTGLANVAALAPGDYHHLALVSAPPALHGMLTDARLDSSGFSVSLPTRSGKTYALEYASALTNAQWTSLPLAAGNGRVLTLTDPQSGNSQRFYRVREW